MTFPIGKEIIRNVTAEQRPTGVALVLRPPAAPPGAAYDLMILREDGSVQLHDAGRAYGAKALINRFLPPYTGGWSLYETRGKWYLVHPHEPHVEFKDGVVISKAGVLTDAT